MKMLQYTVKRFVIMLFTLFIIATATFFLLAATPGDALSARVEKLPDSVAARMYAKYGLDKPVMERYVITMKGLVHGDFGESIIYEGQTVQSIIKEKAPISARLGIQQMLLGVSLGLATGRAGSREKGLVLGLSRRGPVHFAHLRAKPGVCAIAAAGVCGQAGVVPGHRLAQ